MARNRLVPLDWDQDAVALLSSIAPSDVDEARVWWEEVAPTLYQALLDARILESGRLPADEDELRKWIREFIQERLEPESDSERDWIAAGLLFLFAGGSYWTMRGSRVPRENIEAVLLSSLGGAGLDTAGLCEQLRSGVISLASWQLQMARNIKSSVISGAILASGGQLAPDVVQVAEEEIARQLEHLSSFSGALAAGLPMDGNVCRRMRMYIDSGKTSYFLVDGLMAAGDGFDLYRNILGPTEEHCDGAGGCITVSDQGFMPVGSLAPIGTRNCLSNCLCSWQYLNSRTGKTR